MLLVVGDVGLLSFVTLGEDVEGDEGCNTEDYAGEEVSCCEDGGLGVGYGDGFAVVKVC